jgi:WD40 repeat protein
MGVVGSGSQYAAFISYRHKEPDIAVARAIHRALETYRVPAYIQKRTGIKRLGRVFRDQDELPLLADLGAGIHQALDRSEWLIVVCSPDLPLSKWCLAEIDYFIRLGRRDRILTVLAAGEPVESFPPQLRFVETPEGLEEREPLAADVRAATTAKALRLLKNEKLRLLAPMLGVGYDDLRRRQRERLLRTVAAAGLAIMLTMAVATTYVLRQNALLDQERSAALSRESLQLAQSSLTELQAGNTAGALTLAQMALPQTLERPERPLVPAAQNALMSALLYGKYLDYRPVAQLPAVAPSNSALDVLASPDGRTFVVGSGAVTRVYDAQTLGVIYEKTGSRTTMSVYAEHQELYGAQASFARYNQAGDRLLLVAGDPEIIDPRSGEVLRSGLLQDIEDLDEFGISPYVLRLGYNQTRDQIRSVYALETGELLFTAYNETVTSQNLVSPDGAHVVVASHAGVELYESPGGRQILAWPGEQRMIAEGFTFFSPDSRYLVVTTEDMTYRDLPDGSRKQEKFYHIRVLELATLSTAIDFETGLDTTLPNPTSANSSEEAMKLFSPDGQLLILPGADNFRDVYALPAGDLLYSLPTEGHLSFSPASDLITGGSHIWNAADGSLTADLSISGLSLGHVQWLGEDTLIAAGLATGRQVCQVWRREPYPMAQTLDGVVLAVYPDASGRVILSRPPGKAEPDFIVADAQGMDLFPLDAIEPDVPYQSIRNIVFVAGGSQILGTCALEENGRGTARTVLWDAEDGAVLRVYDDSASLRSEDLEDQWLGDLDVVSPDGQIGAGTYGLGDSAMGGFALYDLKTGECTLRVPNRAREGDKFFDRQVTRLLHNYLNVVDVYDARTGELLFALDDDPAGIQEFADSGFQADMGPAGDVIAVTHAKTGTIEIIDATTGERLRVMDVAGLEANCLKFSHDGTKLLFATATGQIKLFDLATGAEIFSVYDPDDNAVAKTFSTSDRYIIDAYGLRDAVTGEKVLTLPAVTILGLSADDRLLFTRESVGIGSTAVYKAYTLPTLADAMAAAPEYVRDFSFAPEDRNRMALE